MMSDSKSKKNHSLAVKTIKVVAEVLTVALVVFLIALIGMVLVQKIKGEDPTLFGAKIYYIVTDSMEPNILVGDLILCDVYEEDSDYLIKENDIVTYIAHEGALAGNPITHRVVKAPYVDADGITYIVTRGDNTIGDDVPTPLSDVRAVYVRSLPILTAVYRVVQNIFGFIFIIVLPLMVVLVLQIVRLVKASGHKEEAAKNEDTVLTAAKKSGFSEQEIMAMMAELNNNQPVADDKPADDEQISKLDRENTDEKSSKLKDET